MNNFYKNFEDEFRGSRDSIKLRLNTYIEFLNILKLDNNHIDALDIACGRGEWLELLKENSINALGCDLDENMLNECKKLNLNVKNSDVLNFLKTFKDDSIDVITAFHFIEHVDFEYLNLIIKESFRILKDSGVLIFETPNPENLRVSTLSFYNDVTHKKPIPPMLLTHLIKHNNFKKSFILRLNSKVDKNSHIDIKNIINDVSPDYALIALKTPKDDTILSFKNLADHISGISFDDLVDKFNDQNLQIIKEQTQDIEDVKKQIKQINDFIAKFKKVFFPLIKIYHILKKIKHFLKDAFFKFLRYAINFANNRPKIKKILKKIVKKFPSLYLFINKILNSQKTQYFKSNSKNISQIFDIGFSANHLLNLELKEHKDYIKNFDDLTIIGHINGSYGLSSTNRNLALKCIEIDKNIHFLPYEESKFSNATNLMLNLEDEKAIKEILLYKKTDFKNSINIYQHYPPIKDVENGYNVIIFFWEESKIPPNFIDIINNNYKAVIVSTYFIKKALIDNGCLLPIKLSNLPLKTPSNPTISKTITSKNEISLLHISSCFPRKGVDVLLKAFNNVCKNQDFDFTLTIKTFHNIHNDIKNLIVNLVDFEFRKKINLIFDDYSQIQMANLYENCDIVILPTRGEGLNMPAIEACYYKKPLIVTKYGAQSDFLNNKATFIDFNFEQAITHFDIKNSTWTNPSYKSLAKKIIELSQKITNNDAKLKENLNELNLNILKEMFSTKTTQNFISSLSLLYEYKFKEKFLKIAIISSYDEECGIAEYSKYIVQELKNLGIEYKIYSWSKNSINSIKIQKQNPLDINTDANIIWLQHHFGFYGFDEILLENLLRLKKDDKIVVITLHSTEPILNFTQENKIKTVNTLSNFDRIFVHTITDLNVLKALGLVDNVTLMPHGIQKIQRKSSNNNVINIGFFGLLFRHKNLSALIDAFSKFSKTHNSILNIVSHPKDELSKALFLEYKKQINRLNLDQKVIWNYEFLPIKQVNEILSKCDVIVLPYLNSDESASGALRVAISCCDNVLVTKSQIFDDMRYLCLEIDGFGSSDILNALNNFVENKNCINKKELINKFIDENSWSKIVFEYVNIFKSLSIDKDFMNFLLSKNEQC